MGLIFFLLVPPRCSIFRLSRPEVQRVSPHRYWPHSNYSCRNRLLLDLDLRRLRVVQHLPFVAVILDGTKPGRCRSIKMLRMGPNQQ